MSSTTLDEGKAIFLWVVVMVEIVVAVEEDT
jgi:hypothetical protein